MKNQILKLTILALLAAIGVVLMSYIQFPYPIAPFLKIEFSDFVVMFAFMLFGLEEALLVAVLKTGCDLMINGPQTGGAFPFVAHLTALIASLTYVLALWLCNKIIKKDKLHHKIIKYSLVVLVVASIMTFANYAILTPLFLGEVSFFGIGISEGTMNALAGITGVDNFFLAIVMLYLPFNLLKGGCIAVISVLVGDTILNIYKSRLNNKQYKL